MIFIITTYNIRKIIIIEANKTHYSGYDKDGEYMKDDGFFLNQSPNQLKPSTSALNKSINDKIMNQKKMMTIYHLQQQNHLNHH